MSKSGDALKNLLASWKSLKEHRPAEADFSAYGYPLSYDAMDELFSRWQTIFDTLESKGYWAASPEVAVSDSPIASQIGNLANIVNNGQGNGVSWMLQSQFLEVVGNIQLHVSALSRRQAGVNKEVAKLLAARGSAETENIIRAAKAAELVLSLKDDTERKAKAAFEASASAVSASGIVSEEKQRLTELAEDVGEQAESISGKVKESEQLLEQLNKLLEKAIKREDELTERVGLSDAAVKANHENADKAKASVAEALREARTQGLALSFQDRSDKLKSERTLWTLVFSGSALLLLTVAIVFAIEFTEFSYEFLIVHLLRKIGLAAPLIWVGWYSARQIGRIAKVQEDYEYKAASALAFQSYKEEVKLVGDAELQAKLMEIAIRTFGENPVRLYDAGAEEPVSPLHAAIKELPADKVASIIAALGDQSVRSKLLGLLKS